MRNILKHHKWRQGVCPQFGFAWSCNCAGPNWVQPDTVRITGLAADSLKNTSVGFASGQPSLSAGNTVAVDPEAGHGGRGGSGYSCDDLLLYIPEGLLQQLPRLLPGKIQ